MAELDTEKAVRSISNSQQARWRLALWRDAGSSSWSQWVRVSFWTGRRSCDDVMGTMETFRSSSCGYVPPHQCTVIGWIGSSGMCRWVLLDSIIKLGHDACMTFGFNNGFNILPAAAASAPILGWKWFHIMQLLFQVGSGHINGLLANNHSNRPLSVTWIVDFNRRLLPNLMPFNEVWATHRIADWKKCRLIMYIRWANGPTTSTCHTHADSTTFCTFAWFAATPNNAKWLIEVPLLWSYKETCKQPIG